MQKSSLESHKGVFWAQIGFFSSAIPLWGKIDSEKGRFYNITLVKKAIQESFGNHKHIWFKNPDYRLWMFLFTNISEKFSSRKVNCSS